MRALLFRMVIAASLLITGVSHAYLYAHGYGHIPVIGPSFLLQASVAFAVAALVLLGGPEWLTVAAGLLALGALVAFGLSRTVGIAGFVEVGWAPAPHALLSVLAEVTTVLACGGWWFSQRPASVRAV
jgi:hypothetical protein